MGTGHDQTSQTLADLLSVGLERPGAIALSLMGKEVSFGQLESDSNRLASLLEARYGIGHGDVVLISAVKSLETILLALALWKLGAVYAPVDKDNARPRLEKIIATIAPKLFVTHDKALAAGLGASVVGFDALAAQLAGHGDADFRSDGPAPEDSAIIIHTSGSTGDPKGVDLSHGSVRYYLRNHNRIFGFDPDSVSMNNGPFHFDVSIQDTFLPLSFGAKVVIYGDFVYSSGVIKTILTQKVTHLIAVSSVLSVIARDLGKFSKLAASHLRLVMTGGETCDAKLIQRVMTCLPGVEVFYGYGPTECNSLCAAYRIEAPEEDRVEPYPFGSLFPGLSGELLDERLEPIREPGRKGVLAVSGPQLMKGYRNNPAETAKVIRQIGGKRFYVTGDVCYRDADGLYHYVGREDTEVKIYGRRINLLEIRNALLKLSEVKHAIVGTVDVADAIRIAAFLHVDPGVEPAPETIQDFVKETLNSYMQPFYLFISDEIARTSTGKISEKTVLAAMRDAIARAPDIKVHITTQGNREQQALASIGQSQ